MAHLLRDEIAQYVAGLHMDDLALHNFKSHLASCGTCSETLAEQARLELKVRQIASEADFCASCDVLAQDGRCGECGAAVRVPGFQIESILVKNSRGRMYVAHDENGVRVALKELAFVQSPSAEEVAAFERESTILRTLSHPGIPKFVAAFQVGTGVQTRFYLAQEFVEGESLEQRMRNHHFSESEVTGIGTSVLEILSYLQALSPEVFHRDVKPSNIIYGNDGKIVLVDFGSARSMGPTASATLVGTFGYMPVEQLGGIISASSDVYALGATMCQLLTRREPWHLLEDRTLLARMNVSSKLQEIIATMVAPSPEDRYSGAVEALHALQTDPSAAPVAEPKGWMASLMASLSLGSMRPVLVGFAAILVLAGGATGYALFSRGAPASDTGQSTSASEGVIVATAVIPETLSETVPTTIMTIPEGASVTVDGKLLRRKTPVTVDLTRGEHRLHVKLRGYSTDESTLTVSSHARDVRKIVNLTRATEPWECDEVTCLVDPSLACCRAKEELEDLLEDRRAQPDHLTRSAVKAGIDSVRGDVTSCLVDNPDDPLAAQRPGAAPTESENKEPPMTFGYGSGKSGNTVKIRFKIEPDGSVSEAKANRGGKKLRECLEAAIKQARFAKSKQGITVSYPFVLKSHPIACDPSDPLCGL